MIRLMPPSLFAATAEPPAGSQVPARLPPPTLFYGPHTTVMQGGGEGGDVGDAAVEVNSSFSVAAFAINSSLSLLCCVSLCFTNCSRRLSDRTVLSDSISASVALITSSKLFILSVAFAHR